MAYHEPELLICIYTCDAHEGFHDAFWESRIGQYLSSLENTRRIYIFADPTLPKPSLDQGRLAVDTHEDYSNLCLKTYKMIKYCSKALSFDYLLKMDVTSGIESMNLNTEIANRVADQQVMIDYLESLMKSFRNPEITDYTGWKKIIGSQAGVERWASIKGLEINYNKLLGDAPPPLYYSGKCYSVSRRFASFIEEHGEDLTSQHTRYLPGSEDMLIGRLYDKYRDDQALR